MKSKISAKNSAPKLTEYKLDGYELMISDEVC